MTSTLTPAVPGTQKLPADHRVRDRVVTDFDTTFLLEAGAGSGKTTVLVSRILAILRTGRSTIERVVAITFTEKAAGELKARLRDEIEKALDTTTDDDEAARLATARDDLERAPVSTIHAFGAALLKERPFEAGLDPGFTVAAEVASDRSFDTTWERWLQQRLGEGDPVLVRAMECDVKLDDVKKAARTMANERDVLGEREEEPAFSPAGLIDTIGGAVATLVALKPSCKETSDEAYQSIEDLEADLERARRLDPASCERLLRDLHINPSKGSQDHWRTKDACRQAKAALKIVKEAQAEWRAASDAHVAWSVRDRLRDFLKAYEQAKKDAAVVDFQDLLLRTRDVLTRAPQVRRYFQRRFDFVLIDEFQDTDPLQVEIAFLLAEDPDAPTSPATTWRDARLEPGKLFLVGDPKQSIYRFRRADIALYQEAKRLVQESGGEVLQLDTSFRTVPSIVGFVDELFDDVFRTDVFVDPEPLPLTAYRGETDRNGARTIALPIPRERLPQESERNLGAIRPIVADTIAGFLEEITRRRPWSIREGSCVRAARPGDVALLVRKATPDFLAPLERALLAHEVPYRIVGGKEYFVRDEVRALGAVLRAIDNPADRLALFAALRSPFFAFSDDDLWQFVSSGGALSYQAPIPETARNAALLAPAFETLQHLHRLRRRLPPSDVIVALLERTRALAAFRLRPNGDQLVANLWKTIDVSRAYEAAGPTTLREVVRFLEEEAAQGGGDEGDSPVGEEALAQVAVMTIHAAKGLEYPIVLLGDILTSRSPTRDLVIDHAEHRGWLKIGSLKPRGWEQAEEEEKRQAQAEERRLLYVALTRAKDHLVIPWLPGASKAWTSAVTGALLPPTDAEVPYGARVTCVRRDPAVRGRAQVTVFDSRSLRFDPPRPATPSSMAVVETS